MEKMRIREAIVVEGRDDVDVVRQAVDALVIATHGFGIDANTWGIIDKAYREKGLIILTDPDHAGEQIRRRLTDKYPEAKQAYLTRELATAGDDIGIENATLEAVVDALSRARATAGSDRRSDVTMDHLIKLGLAGAEGSAELRERVATELCIGYGNAKSFLNKLRGFGITAEELRKAVHESKLK